MRSRVAWFRGWKGAGNEVRRRRQWLGDTKRERREGGSSCSVVVAVAGRGTGASLCLWCVLCCEECCQLKSVSHMQQRTHKNTKISHNEFKPLTSEMLLTALTQSLKKNTNTPAGLGSHVG